MRNSEKRKKKKIGLLFEFLETIGEPFGLPVDA